MCGVAYEISRRLTWLASQPLHKDAISRRFLLSEGFDRSFRNEEVTGSNPVSSTIKLLGYTVRKWLLPG